MPQSIYNNIVSIFKRAKIVINGHELELDMLDADVVDRYQELTQAISEKVSNKENLKQYDGLSTGDGMRALCKIVDEYLDNLFGEGTAQTVFEGNTGNWGKRLDAFLQCVNASQTSLDEMTGISERYGMGRLQNRAQRRAATKKK